MSVPTIPPLCVPPGTGPTRPRVPLAPVLSRASFAGSSSATPPSVLDAGTTWLVTSGRIALALALRALGVGPGDSVLLPAYHSLSMVPPVLWRGAAPLFYRVGMDTAVDLDDVATRLGPAVKALVVTHYFGFPQDMMAIRAFCDRHHLALVEDCAHCFFGEHAGRPVGAFGDVALASSMKFFPAYDGGVLVSQRPLDLSLRSAGIGFELKALLNTLERGFEYGRLPLLHGILAPALGAKERLWGARKRGHPAATALAPRSSDSGIEFDPAWVSRRASWTARCLLRRMSGARIVERRRERYQALQEKLTGLPGCRPLFARLPEGACPWLFPLLLDDPEPVFARLCAWGVPVTRFASSLWSGMDATTCPASTRLSRHVLAVPVHQELLETVFGWLAGSIREARCA